MANSLFVLWLGLSAGLLLLFFYAAIVNWRNRQIHDLELGELLPSFLPVDVVALQELTDPALEQRLKQELGKEELVQVQREHAQLGAECLRRMAHNAALLQRLGYSQLHSPNPLICSLAQEMIDAGVNVRLYAFIGLVGLRLRGWLPLPVAPLLWLRRRCDLQVVLSGSIIPAYQALKDKAGNLTCLKFCSLHEELFQSL